MIYILFQFASVTWLP